jgi:hypothetical protein
LSCPVHTHAPMPDSPKTFSGCQFIGYMIGHIINTDLEASARI